MTSSRKNSITGSLGLIPRLSVKPAATVVSAEYLEALKVLSDETMSNACDLLLSDRDYDAANAAADESKSDSVQLQELYSVCCKAAKVIEKEAVTLTAQPSLPTAYAPAARSSVAAASRTHHPVTKTMIPNRRMTRLPIPAGGISKGGNSSISKRNLLERETSDSSFQSTNSTLHNKKPRTASHSIPSEANNAMSSALLPPLSAMQFLAKLNNDKPKKVAATPQNKNKAETTITAVSSIHASSSSPLPSKAMSEPDATGTTTTKLSSLASTAAALRTQPPRASRK